MPKIQELYERYYAQGLRVIAIHTKKDLDPEAALFIEQHKYSFPVCFPASREVFSKYHIKMLPAYCLIDRKGQLVWGPSDSPPSQEQIERLLEGR